MLKTIQPHDAASQLADAPGVSPFKVKGVAYIGHLDYCDRFIPGGSERVLKALPEWLQPFFEQKFLAGNWYDVFPLAAAGFVCAELMGLPFYEFIRQRSGVQAKDDIKGVYHFFFAIFSTRTIASKLPVLFSQYFNFGEIALLKIEKNRVEVDRTNVPALIVHWQNAVLQGYLEVVLEQAGAKEAAVEFGVVEATGEKGAYEMVKVPTALTWA
jgi:hypothetical protein